MATENEILIAVIKQLNPTKLNYKNLAEDIGSPNAHAAYMKWSRMWNRIQGLDPNARKKPTGITKAAKKPGIKIGTLNKKAKGSVKVESEESMMENGGTTEEDDEVPVTPKRLPKRKASERVKEVVKRYKEETGSEEEEEPEVVDEEEDDDFDIGELEA